MRTSSGSLPAQAALARLFVPGDQNMSEANSHKSETPAKNTKNSAKDEKIKEKDQKDQKDEVMEEEWWTGDDVFVPKLK
ncbi:hypothetical protein diail_547 [Diaporthe ilicicola]|nr:hypothetical protein diail_547 [Diaporthe ilicicola]